MSRDEKILYVVGRGDNEGDGAVITYSNTNPAKRLNKVNVRGAYGDNIHWVNGRLILAGPGTHDCHLPNARYPGSCPVAGYHAYIVNPETLALTVLSKGGPNPKWSGTSVALTVGKTLWLGSFEESKLAYRTIDPGS